VRFDGEKTKEDGLTKTIYCAKATNASARAGRFGTKVES
jgi:hypothetical protein